jgi:hypothetical protein
MPNINDLIPSRYLKAHELQGRSPIVTIDRVAAEVTGRKRETKPVVYFVGKAKGMLINRTLATAITQIAGSPLTENWRGVKVQLIATTATYGDQSYPVVRIQAPTAATRPERVA